MHPGIEKLPPLVSGLLLLLIGWHVYALVSEALAPVQEPDAPAAVVQAPKPRVSDVQMTRSLTSMNLFGQADAPADRKKQIVAPDTKLALTLRGIFAKNDKHEGLAIIQNERDKKQQHFTVKQNVFKMATLEEIYDDRVILLRNGKYETLRLPDKSLPGAHYQDSPAMKAERKRVASNYRDRFLRADGMDLIKLFGFKPHFRGGGLKGFTVTALGDEGRAMMETLGAKEGDLVTVVNGQRLSESLEAVESLKELKSATLITGIVERDGQEIPFSIELDPPALSPAKPARTTIAAEGATSAGGEDGAGLEGEDEHLGPGWDETEEAELYKARQRARITVPNQPVEFDH